MARRDETPDALITEIRESTTARHTQLLADPPTDPSAPAPGLFGAIGWTTGLLLRNRPLDVWMHEQDVRRALDMPGNLDSAPAVHTADYLMESLPFIVGKRAQAPAGSVVRLEVDGHDPVAAAVGEDGRGRAATPDDGSPPSTLAMDRETFIVLAGGRRPAEPGDVRVSGDTELGERVVAAHGGHAVSEAAWTTDDIGDLTGRTAVVTGPTLGGLGSTPRSSWPGTAPASRSPDVRRRSSTRPPRRSPPRCRTPPRHPRRRPLRPRLRARAAAAAAGARAAPPARQQRRDHGHAAPPHRRRARVADGDQPLRAVPADRAAARPARRLGRGPGGHAVVADAPAGPLRAARRPAGPAALQPVEGLRPDQARQPALHLRARPSAAPGRPAGARRSPPTPAWPAPTSSSTARCAASRQRGAAILDAAVKAVSQSAEAGAWPSLMAATADLPGGTYVGPGGPGQASGRPRHRRHDARSRATRWRSGGCGRPSEETVGLTWP